MVKIYTKGLNDVNSIKIAESFNNKMMNTTSIDYAGTHMYGEQRWGEGYNFGFWWGATVVATIIGVNHLINKVSKQKSAKQKSNKTK